MILLDTCVLIFDALTPERLSKPATDALEKGEERDELACSSISLWEIALLIAKGRLKPGKDALVFIQAVLLARHIHVMEITPEIAVISAKAELFEHADPADRIIGATALVHKMTLITSDVYLATVKGLSVVW